jgi:hypothetical protein
LFHFYLQVSNSAAKEATNGARVRSKSPPKRAWAGKKWEKMGSSLPLTLEGIVLFFPYLIFNFFATFCSLETLW